MRGIQRQVSWRVATKEESLSEGTTSAASDSSSGPGKKPWMGKLLVKEKISLLREFWKKSETGAKRTSKEELWDPWQGFLKALRRMLIYTSAKR